MSLTCRECGQSISREAEECPRCKNRAPFACAVCGKGIGSLTLNVSRTKKNPLGSFSQEGRPLCHLHRLTRCHNCEELFPLEVMTRRTVGTHLDTHNRRGKTPRVEPVDGHFCPKCNTKVVEEELAPAPTGSMAWLFAVLAFGVCVLAGLLLVLMHKFG